MSKSYKYDRNIQTAARLITKFGESVIWNKRNVTSDPAKPWESNEAAPTEYPVKMVFLRSNGAGFANALFKLIKGTDVPDGSVRALMAQTNFNPELTDLVDRNGTPLKPSVIDPVAPGGIIVMYVLEFKA